MCCRAHPLRYRQSKQVARAPLVIIDHYDRIARAPLEISTNEHRVVRAPSRIIAICIA